MGHIFSKKKESKVTEQDKAVLQLKTTRDKIRQYQKRADATLEKDRQLAKELLLKKKLERAKLLLRRKRFIEGQLQKTEAQLENIERMIQDIEFAQVELKVVEGLKVGNTALKQINELISIEDVEQILDETQEAVEKQREIDALLSGGLLTEADEDEVEKELDTLLKGDLEELPSVPSAAKDMLLPEVPKHTPKDKIKEQIPPDRIAIEAS